MESNEFCAGYRQALKDLQARIDDIAAQGCTMTHYDISYWIAQRREYLKSAAFGSDFTQTITGTSTGPQDGLRRGADTP